MLKVLIFSVFMFVRLCSKRAISAIKHYGIIYIRLAR